ncbi:MAG: hypothetical protein L3J65_05610 [Robiginitomaculum sp.]|nr:hypothetical protein [Robiginitomaculum sp.]
MIKSLAITTISLFALSVASSGYAQEKTTVATDNLAKIMERLERLEMENKQYKARLQEIEQGLEDSTLTRIPAPAVSTKEAPRMAAGGTDGVIKLNHSYSYDMLDPTLNINSKQLLLLQHKQDGRLANNSVYIGGSITAIANYWSSNRDSEFGYLMRHPTANNQVGKVVSEATIHSAQTSFTANIGDWVTAYGEFLYDPEQSFGAGTNTALSRNQVQLRQGYVLFGNLNKSPIYGAIGKMNTPFGLTDTVNPFTGSTNWHAFGGLANGALFGYSKNGLHIRAQAVQGGSQFRAANVPVNGTNVPSKLNNYVVDANYTFNLGEGSKEIMFGASYERGSAYCQSFPVVHFQVCPAANPAWAAYGRARLGNLTLQAEFDKTVNVWPGTFNPTAPLDIFPASKVSSFLLGGKYTTTFKDKKADLSFEFSNFVAGPDGSPWERQNQWVVGSALFLSESAKLFTEGVLVEGYAPLNFISGGNLAPGETHSDVDATSIGVIIGVNVAY